ncbi:lipocalin-like, partial [Xiphophorus couchianus]|uniref:lipocalin-like n=1 Tax=Xiphophorus couchianus TaxID=32473 RepID=UPI0010169B6B
HLKVILNEWFLIFCLLQLVGGKWYLIGFATNSKWFINIKNTMKMGVATLVSTAEGDVDLSYAIASSCSADGSCWRRSNRAKKTDMPGKFTFVSWGSKNDIIVVDVKYDDYALVYDIKTKQKVNKIIHLYGRRDEVSANVKEKFKQLALDAGTLAENIVFLPKNGTFKSLDPVFVSNYIKVMQTLINLISFAFHSRVPTCLISSPSHHVGDSSCRSLPLLWKYSSIKATG